MQTTPSKFNTHPNSKTKQALPETSHVPPLEEMIADIDRLIAGLVTPYVDPSNPLLHFDELRAECYAKLAQLINKGYFERCGNRAKIFALLKTSFKNLLRSLIQKYAFTQKRTGYEGTRMNRTDSRKPVHLSLHDEGVQIGILDEARVTDELLEELLHPLSPAERAVLLEIVSPSEMTVAAAYAEQSLAGQRKIKITSRHLAAGMGMSEAAFKNVRALIRNKCFTTLKAQTDCCS